VHPSEDYVVYSLGSIVVIKSLIDLTTTYLKGHEGQICVVTSSKSGKLLATGEQVPDAGFQAALIVWDFATHDMLYRVKFHKQKIQGLSFSCDDTYLVSLGGKIDGNLVIIWNMAEGKSEGLQVASN
jgi:WD40 repeat protein